MFKIRYFSDLIIGAIGSIFCGIMFLSCTFWLLYDLFFKQTFFVSFVMVSMAYLFLVGLFYCLHIAKSYFVGKYIITFNPPKIEKSLNKPWVFLYKRISLSIETLKETKMRSAKSTGWVEPNYSSDGRLVTSGHYQTTESFVVELLFADEWFDFNFPSHLDAKNFLQKVISLKK